MTAAGPPPGPLPSALRIVRPGHPDCVVPLLTDREYQIGRAETVEITFRDETVSRVHGFLHFDAVQGVWMYRDAGSTFGSAIGGSADPAPPSPIPPRQGVAVGTGQCIALGTGGSRLDFLDGIPDEALAGAGTAERTSAAARALDAKLRDAGDHVRPVLLLGPPGCGKSHVAARIHQRSGRQGRFVTVHCGNLPSDPTALWSELLGHVQGGFAGAVEPRPGQIALADGGTLFLHEVEALDWDAQRFLMEVLDGSEELVPLGSPPSPGHRSPDLRLIAASRQPLDGSPMRSELVQLLSTGEQIEVPDLEARYEDVPGLARRFLEELAAEQQVDCDLSREALELLSEQEWPGNVRELRHVVRAVAVRSWWKVNDPNSPARRRPVIGTPDLRTYLVDRTQAFGPPLSVSAPTPCPPAPSHAPRARKTLSELTRADVKAALQKAGGNLTRAALALGISNASLRKKLDALGIALQREPGE